MDSFVESIKQYPAKEQAELRVRVMVPGSWLNNLSPSECSAQYTRQRHPIGWMRTDSQSDCEEYEDEGEPRQMVAKEEMGHEWLHAM